MKVKEGYVGRGEMKDLIDGAMRGRVRVVDAVGSSGSNDVSEIISRPEVEG